MIERSKRFGIGKPINSDLYFHKDYIDILPFKHEIEDKISVIPSNFIYTIIRFNTKNQSTSLMYSPCFNDQYHPPVLQSLTINSNFIPKPRTFKFNPPIYHHRWTMVLDDFEGFNVQEDRLWSSLWSKTPFLDSRKYGKLKHWKEISLPKIFKHYKARSIEKIIKNNSLKGVLQ